MGCLRLGQLVPVALAVHRGAARGGAYLLRGQRFARDRSIVKCVCEPQNLGKQGLEVDEWPRKAGGC